MASSRSRSLPRSPTSFLSFSLSLSISLFHSFSLSPCPTNAEVANDSKHLAPARLDLNQLMTACGLTTVYPPPLPLRGYPQSSHSACKWVMPFKNSCAIIANHYDPLIRFSPDVFAFHKVAKTFTNYGISEVMFFSTLAMWSLFTLIRGLYSELIAFQMQFTIF